MLDQLALHMIRLPTNSTILSYHSHAPSLSSSFSSSKSMAPITTTAEELHKLVRLAGQSVYWRKIFEKSNDPTFVLLTILWHGIYSWDEALSSLYTHVQYLVSSLYICVGSSWERYDEQSQETRAIKKNESELTQVCVSYSYSLSEIHP